jgi:carboxypeptidase Q
VRDSGDHQTADLTVRTTTRATFAALLAVALAVQGAHGQTTTWIDQYREPAKRLIDAALSDSFAWNRLAYLTDTFGHRLSGSKSLNDAIHWAAGEMKRDGLEDVHTERVMVPRWVRGQESAEILEPGRHALAMLGLGDSIGTPPGGIKAELLIVNIFIDLDAKSAQAKGKIVLFNVPYTSYEETRAFRSNGPSRAAHHGAAAVLVRSVGPPGLRLPHTGALYYASDSPRIPAAAIATEDADRLQRMADRGARIVVRLTMEARFEPDVESFNLLGELKGREQPDQLVVIGCHIDSWDVGTGASDDAGGCVATWDALRLMKKLKLTPRRTVRVVLWTNEENGGRGGIAYRDTHRSELPRHVMMLESDTGVFRPTGFGFSGNERGREAVKTIASLLQPLGADQISPNGGGSDIDPSVREGGIPAMSTEVAGDYFLIHHTNADTVDKIDPVDLSKNVAAIAVMTYVIADLPQRLGH